jgi:ComF family protein
MDGRVIHLSVTGLSQWRTDPSPARSHRRLVLSKLLGLVVPPLCVACGADAGAAAPLCRQCRAQMHATAAGPARASPCWAAFAYDGPAGALVRALKFHGRVAIADVMAAQMAALAPADLLRGCVVPVPVHPDHRRRRGIDHAAALAKALARRTGLLYAPCLVRGGDPQPQVGRGRRARMRGPAGSVTVAAGISPPADVLLIDDVVTTGATLATCIRALSDCGSAQVTPIAYARTSGR